MSGFVRPLVIVEDYDGLVAALPHGDGALLLLLPCLRSSAFISSRLVISSCLNHVDERTRL